METSIDMGASAEIYLCLSYAFRSPDDPAIGAAFIDALPGELAALAEGVDRRGMASIDAFRAALDGIGDATELRVLYNRLFVMPPRIAPINAGIHLDRAVMGGSVALMEASYTRFGLARAEGFRDVPDHLAVQLAFLAYLFARAAEADDESAFVEEAARFLRRFVLPWLPGFAAAIDAAAEEHGYSACYARLADVLLEWGTADAARVAPEPAATTRRRRSRPEALLGPASAAAKCRICGEPYIRARQLAKLARRLAAQGLGTEHLDTCPDCRDSALGVVALDPPTPKRLSDTYRHKL